MNGKPSGSRHGLATLLIPALLVSMAPLRARADTPTTKPTDPGLEAIVVTATRTERPHRTTPASISIVGPDALQLAQPGVSLAESLARVPGVLVQESGNFAQDARLQIRGFGTRAAFGIREIKVFVDGLPTTLADGQTQIDDLDLGMVDRIEVLRGASAALYGNAAGGVLQIFTRDPPDEPGATARVLGGSFGLLRATVRGGASWDSGGGFAGASWFQQDGYRDHARSRALNVSGKSQWKMSDTTDVTILLNAVDAPEAQDPGGLTEEEVKENRRAARDRNVLLDAGERVSQVRVGVVGSYREGPHEIESNLSFLYRDFFARLPILPEFGDGIVSFDRFSPSGGLQYQWNHPVLGWKQRLTTGIEAQYQHDDRKRWANEEGSTGELGLHQVEEVTGLGLFLREDIEVLDGVELTGGIRYDAFFYDVDVKFPQESGDSGSRTMDRWSPSAGILWTPRESLSVFATYGTAFQVPTTTELVNPDGPGFNAQLQPQTAHSWEVGIRHQSDGLTVGIAFFLVDIDDELIPYETVSGRIAFRNAGRSRRRGLEAEGQGDLPGGFQWTLAASALDANYIDYATGDGRFDGNAEPGIPPWQVFGELSWSNGSGFYTALEIQSVGRIPVNDANTATSPAYTTLNLRTAWSFDLDDSWKVQPFFGLRNLTGATYDGTIRINARGGRYYEPAAQFNVYGGIEASWE